MLVREFLGAGLIDTSAFTLMLEQVNLGVKFLSTLMTRRQYHL